MPRAEIWAIASLLRSIITTESMLVSPSFGKRHAIDYDDNQMRQAMPAAVIWRGITEATLRISYK